MSTSYKGLPANISGNLPAAVSISSSTNTNPISVFTTTPHGLSDGDYVDIQLHQVNVSANGINKVTVAGPSAFTIPVAGVGTGVSTGTVQPLPLGPSGPIPSDGDDEDAASVNVQLERLADQTAYLGLGTGAWKLAQHSRAYFSDLTGASWAHSVATLTAGTAAKFADDGEPWVVLTGPSAIVSPGTAGSDTVFAVSGLTAGDLVVARLECSIAVTAGNPIRLALYAGFTDPGVGVVFPGGYHHMNGASKYIDDMGINHITGVSVEGTLAPVTGSIVYVQPVIYPLASGAQVVTLEGDAVWTIDVWRPTGMVQ